MKGKERYARTEFKTVPITLSTDDWAIMRKVKDIHELSWEDLMFWAVRSLGGKNGTKRTGSGKR